MDERLVSIIIPSYNVEKYMEETLQVLSQQTYKNFEVLIADCSTDKTKEIVKRWKKKKLMDIKLFDLPKNGVSEARNYAIDKAQGKYISFLDADDIYSNCFLEIMLDNIEPDVAVFSFFTRNMDDCRSVRIEDENVCELTIDETLDILMYRKPPVNMWCFLYEKDIIDAYGIRFSADIMSGEDGEFMLKYVSHCKSGKLINLPLNGYRVNLDSASYLRTDRIVESVTAVERVIDHDRCYAPQMAVRIENYLLPRVKMSVATKFCRQRRYNAFVKFIRDCWSEEDYRKININANQVVVKVGATLLYRFPALYYGLLNLLFVFRPQ